MRLDLRLDPVAGQGAKGIVGAVVALVVVVLAFVALQDGGEEPAPEPQQTASANGSASGSADGAAGDLPRVDVAELPSEAEETLALIDAGGPYPHTEDDETFHNFEGILPDEPDGYYREYTVPTPGLDHRGARRIVTGAEGQFYWTADHYESFSVIVR